MSSLNIGDKAPLFTLPSDAGKNISLADLTGQKVILYFYPKDDTSGCTQEACDFRDNLTAFQKLGVQVLGVSKDPVKSHIKFRDKYDLNFPLLSDEEGAVLNAYGVWTEKSMYGRKYMGIERSTFLIDETGRIVALWPKVSVTDHVKEVQKVFSN
jgi:peroxiredoxin Q/BCP